MILKEKGIYSKRIRRVLGLHFIYVVLVKKGNPEEYVVLRCKITAGK